MTKNTALSITYSFLLGVLILPTQLYSQTDENKILISGVIRSSETRKPVPYAHVFVNHSTFGTYSNDVGYFIFETSKDETSYELIVSHIAHESKKLLLKIDKKVELEIEIKPAANQLEEIVINQKRDRTWKRQLRIFEQEFLGRSFWSQKCEIQNTQVLEFERNDITLKASARQPLEIINLATGYKMIYYLEHFEHNFNTNLPNFYGYVYMEELPTNNYVEKKKWKEIRRKVYNGSLNHFFYALIKGQLEQEGFKTNDNSHISFLIDFEKSRYTIKIKDELEITFLEEYEPLEYLNWVNKCNGYAKIDISKARSKGQLTILKPLDSYIYVNLEGQILNEHRILQNGYLGWERIAEVLPKDYKP